MRDTPSRTLPMPIRIAIQVMVLGGFAAFISYFSSAPSYRLRGDNEAIVKLSFSHSAQLKSACRERTAEELSKLAPNMRTKLDCPRERSIVRFELDLDGKPLHRIELPPGGLHKDGAATVYRRDAVPAGSHRIVARMSDQSSGEFNHVKDATIDLAPGQVLLVDFLPAAGGFVFSKG
jgi:hypothetical protein